MPEKQIVEAIYENGVLRPLQGLEGVPEGSKVKMEIEGDRAKQHPLLQFAGILSDEEATELRQTINRTFRKVDPNAW